MISDAERIERVKQAAHEGKITQAEADAYLRAKCNTTYDAVTNPAIASTRKRTAAELLVLAVLVLIPIFLIGAILWNDTALAGFSVYTPTENTQENLTNSTIAVTQQVAGLNISGVLYGDGTAIVYFDTPNGTKVVGTIVSDPGLPRTDRASYSTGDLVQVEHAPANASYYFDDGTTSSAIEMPFDATIGGTLLIVANDSSIINTYRLPIIIGDVPRTTGFAGLCMETCTLDPTNGTLRIETTGNVTIDVARIDVATPNRAPQLAVVFAPLTINETTTIDLAGHFVDEDGDQLSFTTGSSDLISAQLNGTALTLTPIADGTGTLTVYASDLQDLVPAEISLNVTRTTPPAAAANDTANLTNTTLENATITNSPANMTGNSTNTTLEGLPLDCTSPNPNLRPTECLLANATAFFPDQDIYWEDLDRHRVAKFTEIGNLLLRGEVVEHSTANPGTRDFRIGYSDIDGNPVPTIWIDAEGDLHLRGRIYEETLNMQPPPGSYSVLTKRSIYLAYADTTTGDLHIRGNIIPYRRSIE